MPGRTADISTSTFKPLNLNEILMVPLAKQKKEDAWLAESAQYDLLKADVLNVDSEKAKSKLDEIKGTASGISDDIINKGIDRSQFQRLRKLKGTTNEEMSTGFLGSAMANKQSAAKFINDLATNKERQAGWSPQQAKQWAMAQVYGDESRGIKGFQGSQNEDGSFNSFSGREMSTKVDEDKFIKEGIEAVAEHIGPEAMRAVKIGGLPAFYKAFEQKTISSKDFNRIMEHLLVSAKTNPDLMNSLRQQAFFTGEKDPTNIGSMEYVQEPVLNSRGNPVIDKKTGKPATRTVRKYKAGASRFGQKLLGASIAGQYHNVEIDRKFLKDELAFDMHKRGLDKQEALNMIGAVHGELTDTTAENFLKTRDNLKLYKEEADKLMGDVNARMQVMQREGASEEEIENDLHIIKLRKDYDQKMVQSYNATRRIDEIYKTAEAKLPESVKVINQIETSIRNAGSKEKLISDEKILLPAFDESGDGYGRDFGSSFFAGGESSGQVELKEEFHGFPAGTMINKELMQQLAISDHYGYEQDATPYGKANNWDRIVEDASRTRDSAVESYLKENKKAGYFKIYTSEAAGKYSTELGAYNKTQSQFFNPNGASLANGNRFLTDDPNYQELLKEGTKPPTFEVGFTGEIDKFGNLFKNVLVKNDKGSVSFQVLDPANTGIASKIARQFQASDNPALQSDGRRIEANMRFGKAIHTSGMGEQNQGGFITQFAGNDVKFGYNKVPGTTASNVFMVSQDPKFPNDKNKTIKTKVGNRYYYGKDDLSLQLAKDEHIVIQKIREREARKNSNNKNKK